MSKPAPPDLYLDEIAKVKATKAGTKETSYYPAVAMVVNAVGQKLKPSVYCLHHPSGKDGIPDFGLFEQAKFKKSEQPSWKEGISPERNGDAQRVRLLRLCGYYRHVRAAGSVQQLQQNTQHRVAHAELS